MSPGVPQLIDDLYAGTMDNAAWNRAIIGIADRVRGSATLLLAFNPTDGTVLREECHRLDPTLLDDYRRHWTYQDCRRDYLLQVPVGHPVTEQALRVQNWERSPILNEFLRPADIPHFMPAWLRKSPTIAVTLSIQGTRKRGPFEPQDIESLREILPHVSRALTIRDRLEAASFRNDTISSCMDCVSFGVISLGPDSKILHANAPAEEMLRHEKAIRAAADRTLILNDIALTGSCRPIGKQLGRSWQRQPVLRIERGPDRWPISVVVLPMPERPVGWISATPASVLLLFFDPERSCAPRSELLAQELRISAREAEIAVLLTMGLNVAEVAQRLSVSIHTVRTHLKAIYAKVGVRSQGELVRRVVTGPAACCRPSPTSASRPTTGANSP